MTNAGSLPPNPADLRTKFLNLVTADLLGPANGPNEIVDEPSARPLYPGCLAPLNQVRSPLPRRTTRVRGIPIKPI
jgi:hypothetical protein